MLVLNLALRFLLELAALAGLGVLGAQLSGAVLAVVLPLVGAAAWGALVAPKAAIAAPEPVRLVVEVLVFAGAAAGLVAADHTALAVVFAAVALVNAAVLRALDARRRMAAVGQAS